MGSSWVAELASHWLAQGLQKGPNLSARDIREFEKQFRVLLPRDFREYLEELNGMELGHDGSMDQEMISFWRLHDVAHDRGDHPPSPQNADLFGFADWSVDACIYAIRLEPSQSSGKVFLMCDDNPISIADSFTDFVTAYLRNDESVLYGKAPAPKSPPA